jgi:chromate transporter
MLLIFMKFFALGWVSFGGPAAHIGYFRKTFVEKENWLSDQQYTQFVALSQFLPGPGSSQVGFSIGYQRAGFGGGIAAFLGFTLPSIILMLVVASMSSALTEHTFWQGAVAGLKILAVIVVADATWGMFNSFCKGRLTLFLTVFTALLLLIFPSIWTQIFALSFAALLGKLYLTEKSLTEKALSDNPPLEQDKLPLSKLFNWPFLVIYLALLLLLPFLAEFSSVLSSELNLFSDFFQAGSLVFGGGHVVLPLLQNILGEQISQDVFLTGYATAQAVPGPMFTLATFFGFALNANSPVLGALIATIAVFLPGFLLIIVVLKNWTRLAMNPSISASLKGVNAAVVGLLLAALYQPIFQSAVHNALDMGLVVLGIYLLKGIKLPIVAIVFLYIAMGIILL